MSTALSTDALSFNWYLSKFTEETTGVEQAIAVSSDGLLIAVSSDLDRASAERLAAIVTGMRSLADGASRVLGKGGLQQVLIELHGAYLFVSAIGGGSALGVVAASSVDLGLIGYQIALLAQRAGSQLTPALITELKNSLVAV